MQQTQTLSEELFSGDNFTSRRTTGHNMYDPNSLMTGEEASKGMTYTNSKRLFPTLEQELAAIDGRMEVDEILKVAPRVFIDGRYFGKPSID